MISNLIIIGQIGRPCGLNGWVWLKLAKQYGFDYQTVWIQQKKSTDWLLKSPLQVKTHGQKLAVRFADCEDRTAAAVLQGALLAVPREVLAPLSAGEYYWCDLQGLSVQNAEGKSLGRVQDLIETGSNDVLVLEQNGAQCLIPFVKQVILEVNLKNKLLTVEWDTEF